MAESIGFTVTKTIERVCVSPVSKEQLLCTKEIRNKDFKRKLTISGGRKKTKACLNLELITGKEVSSGEGSLLTNILGRNCADKNETVVWKILDVRESFELSRKSIEAKKKRQDNVHKKACTCRR